MARGPNGRAKRMSLDKEPHWSVGWWPTDVGKWKMFRGCHRRCRRFFCRGHQKTGMQTHSSGQALYGDYYYYYYLIINLCRSWQDLSLSRLLQQLPIHICVFISEINIKHNRSLQIKAAYNGEIDYYFLCNGELQQHRFVCAEPLVQWFPNQLCWRRPHTVDNDR